MAARGSGALLSLNQGFRTDDKASGLWRKDPDDVASSDCSRPSHYQESHSRSTPSRSSPEDWNATKTRALGTASVEPRAGYAPSRGLQAAASWRKVPSRGHESERPPVGFHSSRKENVRTHARRAAGNNPWRMGKAAEDTNDLGFQSFLRALEPQGTHQGSRGRTQPEFVFVDELDGKKYPYSQEDKDDVDKMSPEEMEAFCVEAEKHIKRRTAQLEEAARLFSEFFSISRMREGPPLYHGRSGRRF